MKKETNKCNSCGKFKPWKQLHSMVNEDEEWLECTDCLCVADRKKFEEEFDGDRRGLWNNEDDV